MVRICEFYSKTSNNWVIGPPSRIHDPQSVTNIAFVPVVLVFLVVPIVLLGPVVLVVLVVPVVLVVRVVLVVHVVFVVQRVL